MTRVTDPVDTAGSVVVTGGGRGIGRGIAEVLASSFAAVVIIDTDADSCAWIEDHIYRDRLHLLVGSVLEEDVLTAAVTRAQRFGRLSGWVNNAAVFRDVDLVASTSADFALAVELNLLPVITGTRAAVRAFTANGTPGAIVNLSSHQAQRAVRGSASYVTAKAAIEGFTRAMAVDHGPRGIRVNAVAPGSIRTERHDEYLASKPPDAARRVTADIERLHPLRRIGTVSEVAATVAFLMSPAASFISGATVPVDGGRAVLGLDPEST